jgi:hypothetical protein
MVSWTYPDIGVGGSIGDGGIQGEVLRPHLAGKEKLLPPQTGNAKR